MPNKVIEVVGAVILRDGLILCAQRALTAKLPGMWEFPGGKIESNESAQEALSREIQEELGVEIRVGDKIERTEHKYEFGTVALTTFYCFLLDGEPSPMEHERLEWISLDGLSSLDWAPADVPAVSRIQRELGMTLGL